MEKGSEDHITKSNNDKKEAKKAQEQAKNR